MYSEKNGWIVKENMEAKKLNVQQAMLNNKPHKPKY